MVGIFSNKASVPPVPLSSSLRHPRCPEELALLLADDRLAVAAAHIVPADAVLHQIKLFRS